jgi:xanthine/CO dehydrogenase XdhC/CoxF family maturation factor
MAERTSRLGQLEFSDVELGRIRGPVGLAIGAHSPAEIAISILAEMTMRLRADDDWEQSVIRATAGTGISPRS